MKFSQQRIKIISIIIGFGIFVELLILAIDFSILPSFSIDSNSNETLKIKFTGSNQTWQFLYPGIDGILNTADDIVLSGSDDLFLPMNRKIEVEMISKDYIYCIDIPELDKSQFAIPDLKFNLNFSTTNTDSLSFVPGSICGRVNDELYRKVYIVSNQDFETWLSQQNIKSSL